MFNGSFLRVCRILRFVKKLDFAFLSLGGPSPGARVWCLGRVPKHRNQWQEVEGLLVSPQKLSVGAYFVLLFLGCGFLIPLSNMSDSPRFRTPWKKIRQKYWTQQETSLFKGHPLSCQWQEVEGLLFNPSEPRGRRYVKNMGHNRNRLYSRTIHASMEKHYVQWFLLKSVYDITVVSHIFDVSSSTGLGIEGYRTCWNRGLADLLER